MLRIVPESFTFTSARNESELNLVFAYSAPLLAKSMVATFKWLPQNEDSDVKINLTWSEALNSYFSYAPKADAAGLRDGPTIILPGPGSLEIRFLKWPSRTAVRHNVVSGLYAGTKSAESGGGYVSLQQIRGNGHDV